MYRLEPGIDSIELQSFTYAREIINATSLMNRRRSPVLRQVYMFYNITRTFYRFIHIQEDHYTHEGCVLHRFMGFTWIYQTESLAECRSSFLRRGGIGLLEC